MNTSRLFFQFILLCLSSTSSGITYAEEKTSDGFNRYVRELIYKNIIGKNYEMVIQEGGDPVFILYDDKFKPKIVRCRRAVQYTLAAHGEGLASITVGECDYDNIFSKKYLQNQKIYMDNVHKELIENLIEGPNATKFRKEFYFIESNIPINNRFYFFNVVIVGHGIFFSPIAILVPEKRNKVILIQYSIQRLCWEAHRRFQIKKFSLCNNARNVVEEFSRQLLNAGDEIYQIRLQGRKLRKLRPEKKYEECIIAYSSILSIDPTYSMAYYYRAGCYQKKAKYREALNDLTKAREIYSGGAYIYREIAWIYATAADSEFRDGKKSKKYMDRATELLKIRHSKPYTRHYETLAAVNARNGNYQKAIDYQKQALKKWLKWKKRAFSRGRKYMEQRGASKNRINERLVSIEMILEKYKSGRPHTE